MRQHTMLRVTRRGALAVLALGALGACANQAAGVTGAAGAAAPLPRGVPAPATGVDAAAALPPGGAPSLAPTSATVSAETFPTMPFASTATASAAQTTTVMASASRATASAAASSVATASRAASTASASATSARSGAAAIRPVSLPASARLGPLEFISQTLNNCGPASVAEVLHYWGIDRSQGQVQAILRADGNPRGMQPFGVPSYVRSLGMDVVMGVEGDDTVVKALVAKGFPVIVNQWVSLTNHIGHFRPIQAYDDAQGGFVASDPFLGPNHFISYAEFDQIWATNHGRFMVIYPPAHQGQIQQALASAGWDKIAAYQADLAQQQRRPDHGPTGLNSPALAGKFDQYRQSYGALNQAFDQIQLGQFDAARALLAQATANKANPVLVDWIAALLPA